MKTSLKYMAVAITALFFLSQQNFAQTIEKSGSDNVAKTTIERGKFVDNDNNGVCDNHETRGKGARCVNFVDKDGNGLCDNCVKAAGSNVKVNCQGHQNGNGCGHGQANCCGRGPCQGKGPGSCCPARQGPSRANPSETPDPKK